MDELEKLGDRPMCTTFRDYAKSPYNCFVENPKKPSLQEIRKVQGELAAAVADARSGAVDLRNRLESAGARETRRASLLVRTKLEAQWLEKYAIEDGPGSGQLARADLCGHLIWVCGGPV